MNSSHKARQITLILEFAVLAGLPLEKTKLQQRNYVSLTQCKPPQHSPPFTIFVRLSDKTCSGFHRQITESACIHLLGQRPEMNLGEERRTQYSYQPPGRTLQSQRGGADGSERPNVAPQLYGVRPPHLPALRQAQRRALSG